MASCRMCNNCQNHDGEKKVDMIIPTKLFFPASVGQAAVQTAKMGAIGSSPCREGQISRKQPTYALCFPYPPGWLRAGQELFEEAQRLISFSDVPSSRPLCFEASVGTRTRVIRVSGG